MLDKIKITALAASVIGLASGSATADQVEYSNVNTQYDCDWDDDGWDEWMYVEQYSNATGDDEVTSSDTGEPIDADQAGTMALSYDDGRTKNGNAYLPDSRGHELLVEVVSTPDGTGLRISDPFTIQQGEAETLDPAAELAIDKLWSFATSVITLPLPDPFDLIGNDNSVEEITRTSGRVHYQFNGHPDYQGIDWLSHVHTPSYTGWYRLNFKGKADPGFTISGATTTTWSKEEDGIWNLTSADFQVYR